MSTRAPGAVCIHWIPLIVPEGGFTGMQALAAAMNDSVARGVKQHRWVLALCAVCVEFSESKVPLFNDHAAMAGLGVVRLLKPVHTGYLPCSNSCVCRQKPSCQARWRPQICLMVLTAESEQQLFCGGCTDSLVEPQVLDGRGNVCTDYFLYV